MRIARIVRRSRTYRGLRTLRRWAADSVVVSALADDRVLKALLAVFVVGSVVSVLASNLGSGIKFLSFLLLFAALGSVTKRRLDSTAE